MSSATTPTIRRALPSTPEYNEAHPWQPFVVDAPFEFTKEFARECVAFLVRGGRKIVFKPDGAMPALPAPVSAPSDLTFVNRLQWGFSSVLAGLGAKANWCEIVAPWLHGPVVPIP